MTSFDSKLKSKLATNHTINAVTLIIIPLLVFNIGYVIEQYEEGKMLIKQVFCSKI